MMSALAIVCCLGILKRAFRWKAELRCHNRGQINMVPRGVNRHHDLYLFRLRKTLVGDRSEHGRSEEPCLSQRNENLDIDVGNVHLHVHV